ncbi:putative nuclease HARBI1, partial [Toxorhynchites rutilus septentrionalis]|uniref:putative nuclease HARBI1 n=1 Tax=Toxorhynchites rutilus septentrionalis TaxID=329112 RepID=UPI00247957B9
MLALISRKLYRKYVSLLSSPVKSRKRRVWLTVENSRFWEDEVSKFSDKKFKNTFRFDRCTFNLLVKKLHRLQREDTLWRSAIWLEKRIAIALYAFGSSAEYRTIGSLFGVGRTTTGELVIEICNAVVDVVQHEVFDAYPPTSEKISEIVGGFEKLGFPQCYVAIDGCHIEVKVPKNEATDYYNFKGWHSVILFAAVDHRYRFTYINVGVPGRSNDSTIFENSKLKKVHCTNETFKAHSKLIEGVVVPILLIGDSAFRLSNQVMKPFLFSVDQPEHEKLFNYHLSACRRVVENAFGHLKARFRRIGKGLEVDLNNVNTIIKTCCILHNLCNNHNDHINKKWMIQIQTLNSKQQPQRGLIVRNENASASKIRNALM